MVRWHALRLTFGTLPVGKWSACCFQRFFVQSIVRVKCWVRVFSKSRMYGVMLHRGSIRSCHVSLSSGRYASEKGVSAPFWRALRPTVCGHSGALGFTMWTCHCRFGQQGKPESTVLAVRAWRRLFSLAGRNRTSPKSSRRPSTRSTAHTYLETTMRAAKPSRWRRYGNRPEGQALRTTANGATRARRRP